jgi:non-ribosomal peptide synthetase-like protein
MTTVGEGAFLADDTMVGVYELRAGWLRVAPTKVGKRAFLGNSGMTAPGRRVRKHGLVAVLSAAPERSKPGASFLGSPPVRLPRAGAEVDDARTFAPPRRLVAARAVFELLRVVPVVLTVLLGAAVLVVLAASGPWAVLLAGPVLLLAGLVAGLVSALASRLVTGRWAPGSHPLWSSTVWRSELADTFVEVLGVPWFGARVLGTPLLVSWLRLLGARIGRGVWCESWCLPEADLVELGDGASVGRGCVLQTHLFHDRVLSTDRVRLEAGASVGPHGVVLPGAVLQEQASVGPASLVVRGDVLPAGSRWIGNPVAPWHA